MLTAITAISVALAALYAILTLINLAHFRPPPRPVGGIRPQVSLLIPARNEADNIGPVLGSVLQSEGVDLEVLVLDDGSADGTGEKVRAWMARDDRVRLIHGPPLPSGWNGKQHACWNLAQAATHDLLVFLDADVRLRPEALSRFAAALCQERFDLASGFPRQVTETLPEILVVPQIHVILLGYLPLPIARGSTDPGLAAGCGQLMAVRREAYEKSGGHARIRGSRHDGLTLPRAFRAAGFRTDIFDASGLAECRMYAGWKQVWEGFAKNATEGMARPVALPVWTVLLGGGHVLPFLVLPIAAIAGDGTALWLSVLAVSLVWGARALLAARFGQSIVGAILHPIGVSVALVIQWHALISSRQGRPTTWRGRSYDV